MSIHQRTLIKLNVILDVSSSNGLYYHMVHPIALMYKSDMIVNGKENSKGNLAFIVSHRC